MNASHDSEPPLPAKGTQRYLGHGANRFNNDEDDIIITQRVHKVRSTVGMGNIQQSSTYYVGSTEGAHLKAEP